MSELSKLFHCSAKDHWFMLTSAIQLSLMCIDNVVQLQEISCGRRLKCSTNVRGLRSAIHQGQLHDHDPMNLWNIFLLWFGGSSRDWSVGIPYWHTALKTYLEPWRGGGGSVRQTLFEYGYFLELHLKFSMPSFPAFFSPVKWFS